MADSNRHVADDTSPKRVEQGEGQTSRPISASSRGHQTPNADRTEGGDEPPQSPPPRSSPAADDSDNADDALPPDNMESGDEADTPDDVRDEWARDGGVGSGDEGRDSPASGRGSPGGRLSELSLTDAEYMARILSDGLQLLQDLARWRRIYKLDDDVIAENARKLLAGDFRHLYSDLPPSQQATVRAGLESMRQMPEAELLKSLDTFPLRTSGVA